MGDESASRHPSQEELEAMSDLQLLEYITYWHQRGAEYRAARNQLSTDHPDSYRTGFSAWWCSKFESRGLSEQKRRLRMGSKTEGTTDRT